ncbi:hypothetical protein F5884DRAFT_853552 [Xylogone sp. PMI_703]|nr:hypothetical protein F5884DRAFT_853552 [Xylogone sp. PMI_703]
MPPKRKTPLAVADTNVPAAPPAKKATKGKGTTQAASSDATSAAPTKKYRYTDPSAFANLEPAKISFIKWPRTESYEDVDSDVGDEEEDIEPGSLQDILNGIANERAEAVGEAINAKMAKACLISGSEINEIREQTEKPFLEKMDETRQKFVSEGKMTEEEAKAVTGRDDRTRRRRRRAKRNLQRAVNNIQREQNKAVRLALEGDGKRVIKAAREKKRVTAEASKPFEEKMAKLKETWVKYSDGLTEEEVIAIVPNIPDGEEEDPEIEKQKEKERERRRKEEEAVHPRVVTDEGFPVTKAGLEKFVKINEEMDKRDPDMHAMYIFNDYAGYGAIEVLENLVIEFNKIIFKKDVSPLEKWAIIEGMTLYLAMGSHMSLMMNENSEGVGEIFDMLGVMFFTGLDMLHEAELIGPTSPLPDNLGLLTLFLLDFMTNTASDFDIGWAHWIVWAADKYGVKLTTSERVDGVKQKLLDDSRLIYQFDKRKGFGWKTEYPKFKREHPGGDSYDITKMPESEVKKYKFDHAKEDGSVSDAGSDDESRMLGTDESDVESGVELDL